MQASGVIRDGQQRDRGKWMERKAMSDPARSTGCFEILVSALLNRALRIIPSGR